MFLEVEDNLIKVQNIVKVSRESRNTVITIKDASPVILLDTNGEKHKKIIDKMQSCFDVIRVD